MTVGTQQITCIDMAVTCGAMSSILLREKYVDLPEIGDLREIWNSRDGRPSQLSFHIGNITDA